MNRKAKNIIFWTAVGFLVLIFITTLIFGSISTIAGAGTEIYNKASKFITAIGLNKSDFFKWSPYICLLAGAILTFMFFKKFNTAIKAKKQTKDEQYKSLGGWTNF